MTNDFVTRFGVAGHIDLAHIDATARIDKQRETDQTFLPVDIGRGIDVGERIAFVTQTFRDRLDGLIHFVAREDLTRCDLDQLFDLFLGHDEFADNLHAADHVTVTLTLGNRQIDVFFVRADRYLCGINRIIQVTAILIEGAQFFHVGRQLLTGILIGLGIPGHPGRRCQLEEIEQFAFGVCLGTDDVDLANLGCIAFDNIEVDTDAVPF